MFRTLYGKLIGTLLVILAIFCLFHVWLTVATTRSHLQAVDQSLNQDLALTIIAENWIREDGSLEVGDPVSLFDSVMAINPGIEIYLLDRGGEILGYSAPPGTVKRMRVALEPIKAFLSELERFPVLGQDPRDAGGHKVFSAAPLTLRDGREGYVYVVLGGQAYESVAAMFKASFALQLTIGLMIGMLLLLSGAGLLSFNFLTRRLRRLAQAMARFRDSDFRQPVTIDGWRRCRAGDEIDQVTEIFDGMSRRIITQVKAIEAAEESRRDLVMGMSHDLRTPLATLQGYIDTLLIKDASLDPDERRRYLDSAMTFSQRLSEMTAQLFELVRLDALDVPLQMVPFALNELVMDLRQKFGPEAEQRSITLTAEAPKNAPLVVGDIGLLERLLENLIENAFKFTDDGGRVTLSLLLEADRAVVRVADDGCGISETNLPQVFDRYFQAASHGHQEPCGTGLGLAIARKIALLHGGTLGVESELGQGSVFTLTLPLTGEAPRS